MLLGEAERALTELQYSRDQSFASGMLLYALNTLYQSDGSASPAVLLSCRMCRQG